MQKLRAKHLCVIRCNRNAKFAWRVYTVRNGKSFQKCFYDHLHGGTEAALSAALQWRDQVFDANPVNPKLHQATHIRKNNTSGRPGVFLRKIRRTRNGKVQHYQIWQAQVPEGITPFMSKSFSIQKYGAELAFKLAVAAREAFEAALV